MNDAQVQPPRSELVPGTYDPETGRAVTCSYWINEHDHSVQLDTGFSDNATTSSKNRPRLCPDLR